MNTTAMLEREAAELRATLESVHALAESADAPRKLGLIRQAITNGLAEADQLQAVRLQSTEVAHG